MDKHVQVIEILRSAGIAKEVIDKVTALLAEDEYLLREEIAKKFRVGSRTVDS